MITHCHRYGHCVDRERHQKDCVFALSELDLLLIRLVREQCEDVNLVHQRET